MEILRINHLGIAVSSIDEKKNFWIEFLHPKATSDVLVELCER